MDFKFSTQQPQVLMSQQKLGSILGLPQISKQRMAIIPLVKEKQKVVQRLKITEKVKQKQGLREQFKIPTPNMGDPGTGRFGFKFSGFRLPFGLIFPGLPKPTIIKKGLQRTKATRKFYRTPSFAAAQLGVTTLKPGKFEFSGLVERPLLIKEKKKVTKTKTKKKK